LKIIAQLESSYATAKETSSLCDIKFM